MTSRSGGPCWSRERGYHQPVASPFGYVVKYFPPEQPKQDEPNPERRYPMRSTDHYFGA